MLEGVNIRDKIDHAHIIYKAWLNGLNETQNTKEALSELFDELLTNIKNCKVCGRTFVNRQQSILNEYCSVVCASKDGHDFPVIKQKADEYRNYLISKGIVKGGDDNTKNKQHEKQKTKDIDLLRPAKKLPVIQKVE